MKRNVRPKWKGVFRIDIVDEAKQYSAREVSGIYVIRSNRNIPRIGGIDRRGILYIGPVLSKLGFEKEKALR